jgi:predicted acetyltransferase
MNIIIEPIKIEEKEVLKNLGEHYIYELSQYSSIDVNDFGLYDALDDLDLYWTDEDRHPFFIRVDNKLAGFILIFNDRQVKKIETNYSIDDFFVMYKYKRQGIGKYCINNILNKFNGKWQIWYHPRNEVAEKFWIKTIDEYTKGNFKMIKNDEPYYDGTKGYTLVFDS